MRFFVKEKIFVIANQTVAQAAGQMYNEQEKTPCNHDLISILDIFGLRVTTQESSPSTIHEPRQIKWEKCRCKKEKKLESLGNRFYSGSVIRSA